jgi:YfiH family protein
MIQKRINSLILYFFGNLIRFKEIQHFISTRIGGFSSFPYESLNLGFHVGDKPEKVLKNRERLASALRIPLENFTFANQVHGNNVKIVTQELKGRGSLSYKSAIKEADAMITNVPGIYLTVLVADCLPILFFDHKKKAIGVAHAGWKGTILGIAKRTVEMLEKAFGCSPSTMHVGIGPSIGPCCYEVGLDVALQFKNIYGKGICFKGSNNKIYCNLWEANRMQLIEAGLPEENIEIAKICTSCNSRYFFSERKEKGKTGRFGAGIMIKY